jgi:hypothetical protein
VTMTIRSQNRNFGPSSTDPTSLIASAPTKTATPTVPDISVDIATIIVIEHWASYPSRRALRPSRSHPPTTRGRPSRRAYGKHPERFVRKIPTPPVLPAVAWINQPQKEATDSGSGSAIGTLSQRRWLVVERLPACAPDLNPVEQVWGNLKNGERANLCPDTIGEAEEIVDDGLCRIGNDTTLAFSFLRHCGLDL